MQIRIYKMNAQIIKISNVCSTTWIAFESGKSSFQFMCLSLYVEQRALVTMKFYFSFHTEIGSTKNIPGAYWTR